MYFKFWLFLKVSKIIAEVHFVKSWYLDPHTSDLVLKYLILTGIAQGKFPESFVHVTGLVLSCRYNSHPSGSNRRLFPAPYKNNTTTFHPEMTTPSLGSGACGIHIRSEDYNRLFDTAVFARWGPQGPTPYRNISKKPIPVRVNQEKRDKDVQIGV